MECRPAPSPRGKIVTGGVRKRLIVRRALRAPAAATASLTTRPPPDGRARDVHSMVDAREGDPDDTRADYGAAGSCERCTATGKVRERSSSALVSHPRPRLSAARGGRTSDGQRNEPERATHRVGLPRREEAQGLGRLEAHVATHRKQDVI